MPEVLIQFTSTKKPILYNQKCRKLSTTQSYKKVISEKKIVSLVVKSRNYYREGITYVAKVHVVKIYVVKVYYILTFSKQPT